MTQNDTRAVSDSSEDCPNSVVVVGVRSRRPASRRHPILNRVALGLEQSDADGKLVALPSDEEKFMVWPDGKRGAISLTYDDGTDSQLDLVIPDLNRAGLRGTFFLTCNRTSVSERRAEWRSAWKSHYHELGNHSMTHPPGDQLRAFDEDAFYAQEIQASEDWLNRNMGEDFHRTFAFPNGDPLLGAGTVSEARDRYRRLLCRKFIAARGSYAEPGKPAAVLRDPYLINGAALTWGDDRSGPAIDLCAQALRHGSWVVLVFHDVVEGKARAERETSRRVHSEIINWMMERQEDLYIDTFKEVYRWISATGRLC
jgi:peptidoglycan/xylan/chitin deacetylase (PgdA/CDA1 family)